MKATYTERPETFAPVGNGSTLYRYRIAQETVARHVLPADEDTQPTETETRTQWTASEVTVWHPLTANKVTEAVIAAEYPQNYEQKLVNEYNAAQMGLVADEQERQLRVEAYKQFLTERAALKAQVDADCLARGIQ